MTDTDKAVYDAVLFDLDGTLLDSAPDMLHTAKRVLKEESIEIPADKVLKPCITDGAVGLLGKALGTDDINILESHRQKFLEYYLEDPLAHGSHLFPGIEEVINLLEDIPWGIVTNKSRRSTLPIVNSIAVLSGHKVLVCGDDLEYMKPDPHTILHACEQLNISPARVVYVGDSKKDALASQAAGTATLAVLYGYKDPSDDATTWKAKYHADTTATLHSILKRIVCRVA